MRGYKRANWAAEPSGQCSLALPSQVITCAAMRCCMPLLTLVTVVIIQRCCCESIWACASSSTSELSPILVLQRAIKNLPGEYYMKLTARAHSKFRNCNPSLGFRRRISGHWRCTKSSLFSVLRRVFLKKKMVIIMSIELEGA